ncbi:MAG TPA: FAD-binding oxidoreductase [Planctomycetota bacterium]|nr:FAD-binding oxidoreductase [Planctomycetota bacterium]
MHTTVDSPAHLHAVRVERIARALRERTSAEPLSLRKKAVSHQVPKARDLRHRDEKVDISDLNHIVEIDPAGRTCTAESGVTFVKLVEATMKHGLVPIVVPELKTITIGGAVSGCSIESMSFVHGGFHDTCLEYEVVTSTGEVLACRPDNEHALLFQMAHGSFGTLGILTKLRFRLIPAKPFVHMTYETYPDLASYKAAIWRRYRDRDVDFMDGIIHSPREYVLSLGRFVDEAPYANRYDWMKIYYLSTRERKEDYLRTPHYFFRYDRGVTNVRPRSFLGRLFLGKFLGSAEFLRIAEKLRWLLLDDDRPTITLDTFIPFSKVDPFFEWYEPEFNHYPLWCVPYRRVRDYEWVNDDFWARTEDELFLDIAIYGMEQRGEKNYHALMEQKLLELGGIKTLIAHNYYSEEDFWKTWNRGNYERAKGRVDPKNVFRDIYTKTCKTVRGLR